MKMILRLSSACILILLLLTVSSACPSCYGAKDSPMTAGMNTAIWVMLGITGVVLSFIIAFFLMIWRRYRRQQAQLSNTAFIDEQGTLLTKNEKGVVEWNNY